MTLNVQKQDIVFHITNTYKRFRIIILKELCYSIFTQGKTDKIIIVQYSQYQ